ncbi:hypothetical protein GCM10028801_33010 [Nocardioides maradonensis]
MSRTRSSALALTIALGLGGAQLVGAASAHANPAGTGLVINEVYGGGGNSGAPYTNDFVELYNPTGAAISLTGLSLQYRSAASTTAPTASGVNALSGSVAAHAHFLVQLAAGSTPSGSLPAPDLVVGSGAINMSATGGQVYLVTGTSGIAAQTNTSAPWTFASSVVDFVGWGSSTTVFEGSNHAGSTANSTSISRATTGGDSNDNASDFAAAAAPSPQGSGGGSASIPYGPGPQSTYTVQAQPPTGTCHYRYLDQANGKVLQDQACTPGALNPDVTQATIGSTICMSGYTTSIRPPSSITTPEKRGSEAAYGFSGSYDEYDHLVSLELGGDPNDARNLWPEPNKSGATSYTNPKDSVENKLHTLICNGSITLAAAQRAIVNDWTTALAAVGYPNG